MNGRIKIVTVVALGLMLGSYLSFAQTAEELLPRAIQLEEVKGELEQAIEIYQTIVKEFPDNRPVAAKAYFHMGMCYEKLGKLEAKKAYYQVIQKYADQDDLVAEARSRIAVLEQPIGTAMKKGMMVRKVWTGPEVDVMGEPSPDGKYLSYVDWETGDLAIFEFATGKKRRLTNQGSWDDPNKFAEFSRWSPDGKQIVYDWYNDDNPAFINLYIIGLDDSEPRILWSNEEMTWAQCYDWSSDGKQILACFSKKDNTNQIALVSVNDGTVRVLKDLVEQGSSTWPQNMRFSPDGHYIVYDNPAEDDKPERDIYVLAIDGSDETSLVEHPANDFVLGWTPGGENILFASDRSGTMGSWSIQVAEGKPHGEPEIVKPDMGLIMPLGFTGKGSFYYSNHQRMNDIYFTELDPETGKIVAPPERSIRRFEGNNQTPSYSPDGKYLAYISRRFPMRYQLGLYFGGNVLCIKSLETGKEHEFRSELLYRFGFPSWSPDGSSVLVVNWDVNGRMGYYRINAKTGSVTPVLLAGDNYSLFGGHQWSPSGKTIYYGLRDKEWNSFQIISRNLDSGKEKMIYQSDDIFNLSISPDGQWLALCFRGGESARLNIISTAGGESRELCRFDEGIRLGDLQSSTWTADGKYILFEMRDSKIDNAKHELCRIPADGGELEKSELKMENGFINLSAHPNGRHIAFSSYEQTNAEIWVMENFLPVTEIK